MPFCLVMADEYGVALDTSIVVSLELRAVFLVSVNATFALSARHSRLSIMRGSPLVAVPLRLNLYWKYLISILLRVFVIFRLRLMAVSCSQSMLRGLTYVKPPSPWGILMNFDCLFQSINTFCELSGQTAYSNNRPLMAF